MGFLGPIAKIIIAAEIVPRIPCKWLWKWLFFNHSQLHPDNGIVDAMYFENNPECAVIELSTMQKQEARMTEQSVRLGPREQQIVELLLQGCDNAEIASQLKMARRTVKAHFNRLFLRFGITGGIKRVKLATLLYRRQLCLQTNVMDPVLPASVNAESSSLSPRA